MTGFNEYDQFDAVGLAELVKNRAVTPEELCEEAIRRIQAVNPQLNAVIHPMFDKAREISRGDLPEGPFKGVPFLLKDLQAAYGGEPLTSGCKAYQTFIAAHDSELVKRYKQSGVIVVGKTNTPELGLLAVTEPELHGPTRNPWDTNRTPGGSSGGTGAAVASGMVPMASGGDGGGSIRIPSGWCGLFGLKPSRGRVPVGPDHGEHWQGAAQEHVLTKSVRDSAAMLDAIHGPEKGVPYVIAAPETPYLETIKRRPGKLKIGFSTRSPLGMSVHENCVQAITETTGLLTDLGHEVEQNDPTVDGNALAMSYFIMYYGEVAAEVDAMGDYLGRKARAEDMELMTWTMNRLGRTFTAGDFVRAKQQWHEASMAMADYFTRYDLYLIPTTAHIPPLIGEHALAGWERAGARFIHAARLEKLLILSGMVEKTAHKNLAPTPFTQLANLCGLPAMSVPLYWSAGGLPCGSQFVAPYGDETTLFQLAAQLEEARPWFDRRPAVHASGLLHPA
ncbi:MAG: amidase family protein [Thermodesulfobacteriota bacterium]|nr:amidase family protein [Thermodesulfobacteriota bacterium]